MWILYSVILLKSHIPENLSWLFLGKGNYHLWIATFLFSFPILIPFLSLILLDWLRSPVKCWIEALIVGIIVSFWLKEYTSNVLRNNVCYRYLVNTFYKVNLYFTKRFYNEWILNFIKYFVYWNDEFSFNVESTIYRFYKCYISFHSLDKFN